MLVLYRIVLAVIIATILSARGYYRKSLTVAGSISAFFVGLITFGSSVGFGVVLIAFYVSSTKLTKIGASTKKKLDSEYKPSVGRSSSQVLACSGFAVVLASIHAAFVSSNNDTNDDEIPLTLGTYYFSTWIWCAYLGHYACCNGDTWASELGVLSTSEPILVTSILKLAPARVPRGTNGGMSVLGTVASAAGGAFIGIAFIVSHFLSHYIFDAKLYAATLALTTLAGLIGSLVDSVLGATLQATYYDSVASQVVLHKSSDTILISGRDVLSNVQVNVISVAVTTIVSGFIGTSIMF